LVSETVSECRASQESNELMASWLRLREMVDAPAPQKQARADHESTPALNEASNIATVEKLISAIASEQEGQSYIRAREIFSQVFARCVKESRDKTEFEGHFAESNSEALLSKLFETELQNKFDDFQAEKLVDNKQKPVLCYENACERSRDFGLDRHKLLMCQNNLLAVATFGYIKWEKVDPQLIPALVLFYAQLIEHQKILGNIVPADNYDDDTVTSECKADSNDILISSWNRLREMVDKPVPKSKADNCLMSFEGHLTEREIEFAASLAVAAETKPEDYIRTREIFSQVFARCKHESRDPSCFEGLLAEVFTKQKLGTALESDVSKDYELEVPENLDIKNECDFKIDAESQTRDSLFDLEKPKNLREQVLAIASEAFVKWIQLDASKAIPAVLMFYAQLVEQNKTLPENQHELKYFITKVISDAFESESEMKTWNRTREMPDISESKAVSEKLISSISDKLFHENFNNQSCMIVAKAMEKQLSEFARPRELLPAIFKETEEKPCSVQRSSCSASVEKLIKLARALEASIDLEKTWKESQDMNRKELLSDIGEPRKLQKIDFTKAAAKNEALFSKDRDSILSRNALGVVNLKETLNKDFKVYNTTAHELSENISCTSTSNESRMRSLAVAKNDKVDLFEAQLLNMINYFGSKAFDTFQQDNCDSEATKLVAKALAKAENGSLSLDEAENKVDHKGANVDTEEAWLNLWSKEDYESEISFISRFLALAKEAHDIEYLMPNDDEIDVMEQGIVPEEQHKLEAERTRKPRVDHIPIDAVGKLHVRLIEVAQVVLKGEQSILENAIEKSAAETEDSDKELIEIQLNWDSLCPYLEEVSNVAPTSDQDVRQHLGEENILDHVTELTLNGGSVAKSEITVEMFEIGDSTHPISMAGTDSIPLEELITEDGCLNLLRLLTCAEISVESDKFEHYKAPQDEFANYVNIHLSMESFYEESLGSFDSIERLEASESLQSIAEHLSTAEDSSCAVYEKPADDTDDEGVYEESEPEIDELIEPTEKKALENVPRRPYNFGRNQGPEDAGLFEVPQPGEEHCEEGTFETYLPQELTVDRGLEMQSEVIIRRNVPQAIFEVREGVAVAYDRKNESFMYDVMSKTFNVDPAVINNMTVKVTRSSDMHDSSDIDSCIGSWSSLNSSFDERNETDQLSYIVPPKSKMDICVSRHRSSDDINTRGTVPPTSKMNVCVTRQQTTDVNSASQIPPTSRMSVCVTRGHEVSRMRIVPEQHSDYEFDKSKLDFQVLDNLSRNFQKEPRPFFEHDLVEF